MIISSVAPGDGSVGEIWLRDICAIYPSDQLVIVTLTESDIPKSDSQYLTLNVSVPKLPKFTSRPIARMTYAIWSQLVLKQAISEIHKFAQLNSVELIMVVLDSTASINIAIPISQKLSLPLITLVWDPPEYFFSPKKYDIFRISHSSLLRRFKNVLRKSIRCAVMSEEMSREYSQYTKTVVIHSGLQNTDLNKTLTRNETVFTIGFSGSIYAEKEFQSLIEALELMNWEFMEKKINLLISSNSINIRTKDPSSIYYLGWMSQAETIKMLQNCDVLYLPYKMDDSFKFAARFSFPTKLTSYVIAQVPILYHGPSDSSITHFFEKYPVGLMCHTNAINKIIECLKRLLSDQSVRILAHDVLKTAFEEELSMSQFRLRMAKFIGVNENKLTPVGLGSEQ